MSKNENREATIRQLYTELNKQGSNGEYEKALKSANKSKCSGATVKWCGFVTKQDYFLQFWRWTRVSKRRCSASWFA